MSESERLQTVYDIKEILRPENTPEMGFESYKLLEGDRLTRQKTQDDFLAGKIAIPELDYPRLDEQQLDNGIRNLQHILALADDFDGDIREAVWNSAAYRMADMYWLKSLIYLQDVAKRGDESRIQAAAEQHQALNESLFGKPKAELNHKLFAEIYGQVQQKQATPISQQMEADLVKGFTVAETGGYCPPVLDGVGESLPQIPAEALQRLREVIEDRFPYVIDSFEGYYDTSISQRPEAERIFTPMDYLVIFNLLKSSHNGLQVILDNDATALSWDIERQAIVVGGRHPITEDKKSALAKVFHEYGVHARRSTNGLSSALPTLGTGLYIQPENGENPDYLTFEEGFASICEMAIMGDKTAWEMKDLEKTAAIALAYRGFDFRQTYEVIYRLRYLMDFKDGEELSSELDARAKRDSYKSVERIFRGTPTALPRHDRQGNPRVLTYNKDLAYLNGKLKALEFIDKADNSALTMAFKGKFDPTIPKQLALAKKYIA